MTFEETDFTWLGGLATFGYAIAIYFGVAIVVCLLFSLLIYGGSGPGLMLKNLARAARDFAFLSFRRVWAIANLTIKESLRKKALSVFIVFAILFMFAGWFIGSAGPRSDLQMSVYVSFVFSTMTWLILPVILLLSCWGLPIDIKARSLHTVTTKPVKKSEILLGRILGYVVVGTFVLGIMGVVGYIWVVRQIPADAQSQLISRVPVYGDLTFADKFGGPARKGISVGDEWEFRSYLEGGTKSRAYYNFIDLNVTSIKNDYERRLAAAPDDEKADVPAVLLEYNFEAYRSQKGNLERRLRCLITIVNPETGTEVPLKPFEVMEYSQRVEDKAIQIPGIISYREKDTAIRKEANLFEDLIVDNKLRLEVECLDAHQYLGMAVPDLFIRMPDKTFAISFFKSVVGLWLKMFLIVLIGVTASCFVKGPVASLLTFSLFLLGQAFRKIMLTLLYPDTTEGAIIDTHGPLETIYRLWTHANARRVIETEPWVDFVWYMQKGDEAILAAMHVLQYAIPDFSRFTMSEYTAKGFDVPMEASFLPCIAISLAYIIPCLLLGYFSLQLREMEAK